ncbi:MAG TPA: AAC(3) family N-acetyltransferase [Vicinamibacterales bacterium]|nr:AAC(3) family N-acetyltransferase [Vicinamibacterales bacterium]
MPHHASIHALVADLASLGVATGDLVMVHASLRRLGPVERGAEGVIEALDEAVGPGGTVMMVLGARDDWAWVNDRPEPERAALLEGSPPFDALATPASPEVGVLAEVFRRTPGTRVSDHPEGRFGARGLLARHLLLDVPWDDYYGPGSPLERLVDGGGKVLRLGADPNTVTLIHYAEYLAEVPGKRRVRRHRLVATPRGPELRIVECLDDNNGIVDYPGGDYFADILQAYLEQGRARQGLVGQAGSELLDARDLAEFAARWMTKRFGSGGATPPAG